jgi:non-specific serine/threonine protein kinase
VSIDPLDDGRYEPVSILGHRDFEVPPLPVPVTSLIGREADIERVTALLKDESVRLVTLAGPGGIGKTRLALAVAGEFDRVGFVSLASVTEPELLMNTIERQLEIEPDIGHTPMQSVTGLLRHRQVLLVLDNLEQILDGTPVISDLLAGCAGLTVLATSRIRLGLSGEHVVPVDPLDVPPEREQATFEEVARSASVRLFAERAHAVHPSFSLDARNIDAVRVICRQLDGLPLAVELAAARSNMLSPESLAARLEHRLELLTGGPRNVPQRLQTMRAAIEWSYELLPESERRFWERLGVFTGGFTADAAIAVAMLDEASDLDPLNTLESLIGQGLIRSTRNAVGEPRFTMLETTREFALDRLAQQAYEDRVRDTHARYFRGFAAQAEPFLMSADPELWVRRLEADLANIRQAMTWSRSRGDVESALDTCCSLAWFWTLPSLLAEGLGWFESLLEIESPEVSVRTRAKALLAAGDLAHWLGQSDKALRMHREALVAWRELGDVARIADTLRSLGSETIDFMRYEEAERYLREARELALRASDSWNFAAASNLLGLAVKEQGRFAEAITLHEEALREWQRSGHRAHLPASLNGLGFSYLDGGDQPRAYESFDAALASMEDDEFDEATRSITGFVRIAIANGQLDLATRLFAAARTIRDRHGTPPRPVVVAENGAIERELRTRLTPRAFAEAWSKGQDLQIQEAVALARTVPIPAAVTDDILSPREHDVLTLLIEGAPDTEIADRLFITRRTASKHVASILAKLEAPNRTAAATIAIRRGLV